MSVRKLIVKKFLNDKITEIIPHIVSTLGDTDSMILKESFVELRQCGGRHTGDHMFTGVQQNLRFVLLQ